MDFEKGDYLVNIEKMKAAFFDELVDINGDKDSACTLETRIMVMMEVINTIRTLGQSMGE